MGFLRRRRRGVLRGQRGDWRSGGGGLCGRGMREGGDDFCGGGFADLAVAVVDAALRKRVAAAACAGLRVELVKRDCFLLGRELGEVHAGKFAGALGIFQKNLSGVLEGFHFDVADGQAEERTDFCFIEDGIAEAFVFLDDAAFRVQDEGSGERGDTAVLHANIVAGDSDGIVDSEFGDEILDGVQVVIVHDEAQNLEAVLIFVLEIDEVGNFGAARSAPGGPEIQQNDFAFGGSESNGLAVEASELEVRRRIGIADETDGGLLVLCGERGSNEAKK